MHGVSAQRLRLTIILGVSVRAGTLFITTFTCVVKSILKQPSRVRISVVPDDVPMEFMYVDNDVPRSRLDAIYDYVPEHVNNRNNYIVYN